MKNAKSVITFCTQASRPLSNLAPLHALPCPSPDPLPITLPTVDRINDKDDGWYDELLPNHTIVTAMQSVGCVQERARARWRELEASLPRFTAVIGPACSDDVADLTNAEWRASDGSRAVVVSPQSTAPTLADMSAYPNLARTCGTDVHMARAFAKLCEAFAWDRVALLHDDSVWGSGGAAAVKTSVAAVNVEVITTVDFELAAFDDGSVHVRELIDRLAAASPCSPAAPAPPSAPPSDPSPRPLRETTTRRILQRRLFDVLTCSILSQSTSYAKSSPLDDVPNMPLAVLLHILAQSRGKSRFDIPVDMRRHMPGLRSTANLTGLIRLEVTQDETPAAIHSRLHESIGRREEVDFVLGAQRVVGVPLWLMRRAGRYAARKCYENHRFVCSATVSNLGNLDARLYSGDGFTGSRVFFIPPGGLALPLFIALTGGEWGLEICAAAPGRLTDQAGLTSLLGEVAGKLGRMEIKD